MTLLRQRKPNRLRQYDYSNGGYYFVTVCTKERGEWFGKIENGKMALNELGKIASIYWADIPKYYPNITLDEWVIMPDHIHGIIVILSGSTVGTEQCSVRIKNITDIVSLSQVIKSFKDVAIKQIRSDLENFCFLWQRSFYDHIIRSDVVLSRIREYIQNNPLNWENDRNNTENLSDLIIE